jgi:hypothetical protein
VGESTYLLMLACDLRSGTLRVIARSLLLQRLNYRRFWLQTTISVPL